MEFIFTFEIFPGLCCAFLTRRDFLGTLIGVDLYRRKRGNLILEDEKNEKHSENACG